MQGTKNSDAADKHQARARRNRWMGSLTVVSLRLFRELGQAHDLLPLLHLLPRRSPSGSHKSPNFPVPLFTFLKRKGAVALPFSTFGTGRISSVLADDVPILIYVVPSD
nr:unnamed protein product [Digitaria exilis]